MGTKNRMGTENNGSLKGMKAVQELAVLAAATLITAAAVFFFLMPSHAAVSSVSGLAIVLSNFMPVRPYSPWG